jgi:DNA helicase-4
MDIASIAVTSAILWNSVQIRALGRVETLAGLSGDAARRLQGDLLGLVNLHLADLINQGKDQLKEVDRAVSAVVEFKRQYLAQSDISRAISDVPGSASQALSHPLFDAALVPAAVQAHLPNSLMMLINSDERGRYNEAFVAHEMRSFEQFFDDLGGLSLSDEQREACIRLEDNNLLVASAGSGKSATMVGKVAYVLEKGIHSADEILVLAFNKAAADELKERIARQLGVAAEDLECRVTTFHALGRGIIEEVEGKPPQLANWVESADGETRFINETIRELTEANNEFRDLWIDLLSLEPKADIPASEFKSLEDYKRYIGDGNKSGGLVGTLAGIEVRSFQERKIVNWLWRRSVEFEYERQIETQDADGSARHIRPDFFYPDSNTIHEHFAIDADGTSPFPNYVEHAALKRSGIARTGADFFETTSAQSDDGSLLSRLREELEKRHVPLVEKSPDDVLKAIPRVVLTHYIKIISVCIKHIRANRLTLDMLLEKAKSLHDKRRAERFATIIDLITEAYSRKLESAQRIDFDSMIGDAVKLVETGRYESCYSLILVDEFQDISDPRANLIKALKHQKAFTKVFAVGDDWQSIYRFSGSDITIFTEFEANFGAAWQGRLERTYRCNQLLADTAAQFIQKNPAQLRKSVRSSRPAIPRSIRIVPITVERNKPSFREACFGVLERLDTFLSGNATQWRQHEGHRLKVLVLWRYNLLDPFQGRPPTFACIDVAGLSFHRSKGLEADYTILLDVSEGDYGVPSRIEDDELLTLVIPRPEKFDYAEERRLFYVALTRASRGTFLLCNDRGPSRYIRELREIAGDDVQFETVDGRPIRPCPACHTGQLVERTGPKGSSFIGCSTFPKCRHTQAAT